MIDTINCIRRYVEIANDDGFIRHWKELSERLIKGIQNGYGYREENIVKIIESIINSGGRFETPQRLHKFQFRISTNSIFIHGNKSHVEFKYYGKVTRRELGDIIFILSVVYNNRKYFEKMTINQIKKSKGVSWEFNKDGPKEQIYLLSRFPTFKGTGKSLIPSKEYNLPNNSGCLGTHGLLYHPGDFALISSKELELIVSRKSKLQLEDLLARIAPKPVCSFCPCCYLIDDFRKPPPYILYILDELIHLHLKYFVPHPFLCNLPLLGNCCISYNAYDFSNKYLLGLIGELIYAKDLPYNRPAFEFLHDLLNTIKSKAKRENAQDVLEFISSFYKYDYFNGDVRDRGFEGGDYDGGGIGIVHTIVNIEGER